MLRRPAASESAAAELTRASCGLRLQPAPAQADGPPWDAHAPLRHALALGLAHGPTELLPISSSAHTDLIPWLAGWPYAELDPELRKSLEVDAARRALALALDWQARWPAPGCGRRRESAARLLLLPPAARGLPARGGDRAPSRQSARDRPRSAQRARVAMATHRSPGQARRSRPRARRRARTGLVLGLAQTLRWCPGVAQRRDADRRACARLRPRTRASSARRARSR